MTGYGEGYDDSDLVEKIGENNTKTFHFSLDKAMLDSIFNNDDETKHDFIIVCEETEAKYFEDGTPYPDWEGEGYYIPGSREKE